MENIDNKQGTEPAKQERQDKALRILSNYLSQYREGKVSLEEVLKEAQKLGIREKVVWACIEQIEAEQQR